MEPTISPTPTTNEAVAIASAIAAHLAADERANDSEATPPGWEDHRWHRLQRICTEQTKATTAWDLPTNPWTAAERLEHRY